VLPPGGSNTNRLGKKRAYPSGHTRMNTALRVLPCKSVVSGALFVSTTPFAGCLSFRWNHIKNHQPSHAKLRRFRMSLSNFTHCLL